jgi:hypothetical protein
MAVGQYTTNDTIGLFTERWNGTQWQLQTPAVPAHSVDSSLVGVSCPAVRDCTAVGFYAYRPNAAFTGRPQFTLAEHWNGFHWRIEPTPNPVAPAEGRVIQLNSVSCPGAKHCTAVGFYDSKAGYGIPFAEHLRGSRWVIQSTPLPPTGQNGVLTGVSCPSLAACTAVGNYDSGTGPSPQPLAERWSGSSWKLVKIPQPAAHSTHSLGVSCATESDCTAVGYYYFSHPRGFGYSVGAWVERWNGRGWQIQSTSRGNGVSGYTGVSCPEPGACVAVGGTGDSLETVQTLGVGEQVDVAPVRGTVSYAPPSAKRPHFVPLTKKRRIPVGSQLDTTRGTVSVTSAVNFSGGTRTGEFYGGQFKVLQKRTVGAVTELRLTGKLNCAGASRSARDVATIARHHPHRHMWGTDNGSGYATGGGYGSGTTQGTKWLTDDSCTGTRFTVVQGVVRVTDYVRHVTVLVTAGHSYLAGH